MDSAHSNLTCTFCGKRQEDVAKLVAGPMVYICNECVALCADIIAEEALETTARGSGKHIAAQPEDVLSVLTFVQQYCDGHPVDSVSVGEIVTKRRALSEANIASLQREHQERAERQLTAAREEWAQRGYAYVNLDAHCASTEGLHHIRDAVRRLDVSRRWCKASNLIPLMLGDRTVGITLASSHPMAKAYEVVFAARSRVGLTPGVEPFGVWYCDPDAFDRALDRIFDDASDAAADNRLRDALRRIPDDDLTRDLGALGKPHQP